MRYFLIPACIFAVLSAKADAQSLRVSLLSEVTVQTETVSFADLLPPDAGKQLKAAAERLSMGRAPQPGSLRVFAVGEIRQATAQLGIAASGIVIPKPVVVRRRGWPIETEAVRSTLARSKLAGQLNVSQARITLPSDLSIAVPHPQFEVSAIVPGRGDFGWLARMRCRERSACGSFLAEIGASGEDGMRPSPLAERSFSRRLNVVSDSRPVLVHPGHLAVLVIEGDGFRITQPVMPRHGARLGELVRVSDPWTHRSLVAQVSGDGMVRPSEVSRKEETK